MRVKFHIDKDGFGTAEVYPVHEEVVGKRGGVTTKHDLFLHVTVHKRAPMFTGDKVTRSEVSWASIGSQDLKVAEQYAEGIIYATKIATDWDMAVEHSNIGRLLEKNETWIISKKEIQEYFDDREEKRVKEERERRSGTR